MWRKWFLLILALAAAMTLCAQNNSNPDADLLLQLNLEEVGEGSAISTRQIGNYNQIIVEQSQAKAFGAQQLGNYNQIDVRLIGAENLLLINQLGNDNVYNLELSGSYNDLEIGQFGDGNLIIQELQRASFLDLTINQRGNANRLEHYESDFGPMSIPMIIEQSGGAQVIITNLATYPNGG